MPVFVEDAHGFRAVGGIHHDFLCLLDLIFIETLLFGSQLDHLPLHGLHFLLIVELRWLIKVAWKLVTARKSTHAAGLTTTSTIPINACLPHRDPLRLHLTFRTTSCDQIQILMMVLSHHIVGCAAWVHHTFMLGSRRLSINTVHGGVWLELLARHCVLHTALIDHIGYG